jgi:hypothetical protein
MILHSWITVNCDNLIEWIDADIHAWQGEYRLMHAMHDNAHTKATLGRCQTIK